MDNSLDIKLELSLFNKSRKLQVVMIQTSSGLPRMYLISGDWGFLHARLVS